LRSGSVLQPTAGLLASVLPVLFLSSAFAAESWRVQYFYDKNESALEIRDLRCPSTDHCVAAGVMSFAKGDPRGVAILTDDGGVHWSQVQLKDQPQALTFLNAKTGWMAGDEGVWKTADGGQTWTRLIKLPGLAAICFLDEKRGFAAGFPKAAYETADGGRTWTKIAAASEAATAERATIYDTIVFSGPSHGFILGRGQNVEYAPTPAWLDPQRAKRHQPGPVTRIILETKNGKTWTSFAKPGKSGLIQIAPQITVDDSNIALGLFDFPDFSENATEVRRLNLSTNSQRDSYVSPTRLVTSMALFSQGFLSAVEVTGQLKDLPIPGKLILLTSADLETWTEMKVDYRAVARRAILHGPDAQHLWVATDTGMILKLSSQ
jgi:hypothetical protein